MDRIVAILNACDNFRDEKIWDWKNKWNKPIIGKVALFQSKPLSQEEAVEIIAEQKKATEDEKNSGKNSMKDMK